MFVRNWSQWGSLGWLGAVGGAEWVGLGWVWVGWGAWGVWGGAGGVVLVGCDVLGPIGRLGWYEAGRVRGGWVGVG